MQLVKYYKWCLKYPGRDSFVALDQASGGYPYPVDASSKELHDFKTKAKAEEYAGVLNKEGFIPVCVHIEITYESLI